MNICNYDILTGVCFSIFLITGGVLITIASILLICFIIDKIKYSSLEIGYTIFNFIKNQATRPITTSANPKAITNESNKIIE